MKLTPILFVSVFVALKTKTIQFQLCVIQKLDHKGQKTTRREEKKKNLIICVFKVIFSIEKY